MDVFAIDIPADLYQRIAALAVRNEGESLTGVIDRLVSECEDRQQIEPDGKRVMESLARLQEEPEEWTSYLAEFRSGGEVVERRVSAEGS